MDDKLRNAIDVVCENCVVGCEDVCPDCEVRKIAEGRSGDDPAWMVPGIQTVLPLSMLYQDTSDEMKRLVWLFTEHDVVPCQGSTGESPFGPCREGDVDYYDCEDGLGYTLSYDFLYDIEHQLGRVIRYTVVRNEAFDGEFDLTRERLVKVLNEQLKYDKITRDVALAIGGKFGVIID